MGAFPFDVKYILGAHYNELPEKHSEGYEPSNDPMWSNPGIRNGLEKPRSTAFNALMH